MEAGGDVAQYLRRSALTGLIQHVNISMPLFDREQGAVKKFCPAVLVTEVEGGVA